MNDRAEQIRSEMVAIRGDLADDVEDVVRSARRVFDWQEYVCRFPWTCLAAATALGYVMVPRRRAIESPDSDTLLELAKRNRLVVQAGPSRQRNRGVMGVLMNVAAKAAVRGATAYLTRRFGEGMRDRTSSSRGNGTDLSCSQGEEQNHEPDG